MVINKSVNVRNCTPKMGGEKQNEKQQKWKPVISFNVDF